MNRSAHIPFSLAHATALLLAVGLLLPSNAAAADEDTWYFGAQPSHTNISFTSRTDLETIVGSTNAVTGSASADLAGGKLSKLDLVVPVASLRTGIDVRDEHLRSANWLDEANFPDIRFTATSGKKTKYVYLFGKKTDGNNWEISGTFSMHGQSKPLTVKAVVREIPAALAKRAGLGDGRWIRVQASFPVTFTEFGINLPGGVAPKVQKTWQVEVTLTAGSNKPANFSEPPPPPSSSTSVGEYNLPAVKLDGNGVRYVFGQRPQGTNISIESKTDLETVITQTNQIGGEALIDTPNKTGKVKLVVPVASLRTGIDMRDQHLRSANWLDAGKHPLITFESTSAKPAGYLKWEVAGNFTMHGVTKPLTAVVEMRIVGPEMLKAAGFADDDTLTGVHFRTTFTLKLADYGISIPQVAAGKVNESITVTFEALGIEKQ